MEETKAQRRGERRDSNQTVSVRLLLLCIFKLAPAAHHVVLTPSRDVEYQCPVNHLQPQRLADEVYGPRANAS